MNKLQWRQLAEDKIVDAGLLLANARWGGAYYLAGFAVECGLKACIMAYVEAVGAIFQDPKYSEKCWTHDLKKLLELANLKAQMDASTALKPVLRDNWLLVLDWEMSSRYAQVAQVEAQNLYNAVTNIPDGVLPWIRSRW